MPNTVSWFRQHSATVYLKQIELICYFITARCRILSRTEFLLVGNMQITNSNIIFKTSVIQNTFRNRQYQKSETSVNGYDD